MPIAFFLDRYTARGTPVRNKNIKVSVLYENRLINNRQKCGSVSALILSICSLVWQKTEISVTKRGLKRYTWIADLAAA